MQLCHASLRERAAPPTPESSDCRRARARGAPVPEHVRFDLVGAADGGEVASKFSVAERAVAIDVEELEELEALLDAAPAQLGGLGPRGGPRRAQRGVLLLRARREALRLLGLRDGRLIDGFELRRQRAQQADDDAAPLVERFPLGQRCLVGGHPLGTVSTRAVKSP